MSFPTIEFAAFFVVVLLGSWLLMPHPRAWKPFMVAASLLFLAYADWRWACLVVLSIVLNQAAATIIGRLTDERRRKIALAAVIAADLGLLGLFKYLGFFIDSVNEALATINLGLPLPLLAVALPIGISFFTLQAIGYVVDVYRRETRVARPWDYAVFASFFPHAVAGPILRAREFIPQLARPRDPRRVAAVPALLLIVGGLAKKIVIADLLATRLVDPVFANPAAHSAIDTGLAILGYAAQIYCDFSAYTDIAIGTAMLLGFALPPNFNRPYSAASLRQFWRRWHMTFTRWMRDYVYVPLGGDRLGQRRLYLNLVVTVGLAGLWHGAAATFLVWSGLHAFGLAAERWLGRRRGELALTGGSESRRPTVSGVRSTLRNARSHRGVIDLRTSVVIATDGAMAAVPAQPTADSRRGFAGVRRMMGGGRTWINGPVGTARRNLAVANQRLDGARDLAGNVADEVAGRDWPRWSRQLTTFAAVALAWVFFRATSVSDAFEVLARLATGWSAPTALATPSAIVLVATGLGVQFVRAQVWRKLESAFARAPIWVQGLVLGVVLVLLAAIAGPQRSLPFIFGTL